MKKVYTILDIETTGLDPNEEQVTEIAAIKKDEHGRTLGTFNHYIKLRDGKEPSKFTPHITKDICESGLDEVTAWIMLLNFVQDTTLIIQYAPFDLSFYSAFRQDPLERGVDYLCTRTLAKILEPNENPSLKETVKRYGVEYKNHHQALYDCEMTWEVLMAMSKKSGLGLRNIVEIYKNTVMDFKDRKLTYIPVPSKVIKESNE